MQRKGRVNMGPSGLIAGLLLCVLLLVGHVESDSVPKMGLSTNINPVKLQFNPPERDGSSFGSQIYPWMSHSRAPFMRQILYGIHPESPRNRAQWLRSGLLTTTSTTTTTTTTTTAPSTTTTIPTTTTISTTPTTVSTTTVKQVKLKTKRPYRWKHHKFTAASNSMKPDLLKDAPPSGNPVNKGFRMLRGGPEGLPQCISIPQPVVYLLPAVMFPSDNSKYPMTTPLKGLNPGGLYPHVTSNRLLPSTSRHPSIPIRLNFAPRPVSLPIPVPVDLMAVENRISAINKVPTNSKEKGARPEKVIKDHNETFPVNVTLTTFIEEQGERQNTRENSLKPEMISENAQGGSEDLELSPSSDNHEEGDDKGPETTEYYSLTPKASVFATPPTSSSPKLLSEEQNITDTFRDSASDFIRQLMREKQVIVDM